MQPDLNLMFRRFSGLQQIGGVFVQSVAQAHAADRIQTPSPDQFDNPVIRSLMKSEIIGTQREMHDCYGSSRHCHALLRELERPLFDFASTIIYPQIRGLPRRQLKRSVGGSNDVQL
jgi:hypothetical protein